MTQETTYYCKSCGTAIHPKRAAMGYKTTCPQHSSADRYSGFMVTSAKDTREVQIIKDPEVAQKLQELDRTKGRI